MMSMMGGCGTGDMSDMGMMNPMMMMMEKGCGKGKDMGNEKGKGKGKGKGKARRNEDEDDANLVCSVHGKKRTPGNLMDDGEGGKCCSPGHECQVKGGPSR